MIDDLNELTDEQIVDLYKDAEPVDLTEDEINHIVDMVSRRFLLDVLQQSCNAMLGVLHDNSRFVSLEMQRKRNDERMNAMRDAVLQIKRVMNLHAKK